MREYFCGWYFKCQSDAQTLAVIPAVHQSKKKNRVPFKSSQRKGLGILTFLIINIINKKNSFTFWQVKTSSAGTELNYASIQEIFPLKALLASVLFLLFDMISWDPFIICRLWNAGIAL